MIQDVDESLRALVKRDALNGSKADVAFDAPTKEWSSRRNTPTVDLYLYDIREDLEQREVMWESVRDDSGFITERRPPARRFKLSYLVTAWTQRPEDEHRLLSSLLSCFLRNQTMPVELIAGSLVGARLPITLSIALPPPQDRSISDVWSAMGGELKASLDLVVNAPFEIKVAVPAGPPVLEEPRFTYARPDGETEDSTGSAARSGKGTRGAGGPHGAKPAGPPRTCRSKATGRRQAAAPRGKPGPTPDPAAFDRSANEQQPARI